MSTSLLSTVVLVILASSGTKRKIKNLSNSRRLLHNTSLHFHVHVRLPGSNHVQRDRDH